MLQRQHDSPGIVPVKQRRATRGPRAPCRKAIVAKDILPFLVLQVAVHADNKDAKWATDVVAAYKSQEFKDYLAKNNKGLWWIPAELK